MIKTKQHFATTFRCLTKKKWFKYIGALFSVYLTVLAPRKQGETHFLGNCGANPPSAIHLECVS